MKTAPIRLLSYISTERTPSIPGCTTRMDLSPHRISASLSPAAASGCMTKDIQYIYDNCPNGTTVVIY